MLADLQGLVGEELGKLGLEVEVACQPVRGVGRAARIDRLQVSADGLVHAPPTFVDRSFGRHGEALSHHGGSSSISRSALSPR